MIKNKFVLNALENVVSGEKLIFSRHTLDYSLNHHIYLFLYLQ